MQGVHLHETPQTFLHAACDLVRDHRGDQRSHRSGDVDDGVLLKPLLNGQDDIVKPDVLPSTRYRSCRKRARGHFRSPPIPRARLPPLSTTWQGSCGRNLRGSSVQDSGRPCASPDAPEAFGRRRLQLRFALPCSSCLFFSVISVVSPCRGIHYPTKPLVRPPELVPLISRDCCFWWFWRAVPE